MANDRYGNPVAGDSTDSIDEASKRMRATPQGWSSTTSTINPVPQSSFSGIKKEDRKTLDDLIASLTAGTPGTKEAALGKTDSMAAFRDILASYSSGAAGADTATAMQYLISKGMEKALPNIQRSIEGAGTSGGAMQALLAQNAATEAAGQSALLGAKVKTDYGQISTQAAQGLGQVAGQEDPALRQLLDALKLTGVTETGIQDPKIAAAVAAGTYDAAGNPTFGGQYNAAGKKIGTRVQGGGMDYFTPG